MTPSVSGTAVLWVVTVFGLVSPELVRAESPPADYPLKPVPFNEVKMTSAFWRPRLVTQRRTLVPFAFERTQPGVAHLKAAADFLAGKKVEGHRPHRFIDSDLYKVMEGAAYLLQLQRDPELEATLDELADIIASAQHEDGYLYPSHTTGVGTARHMMGDGPLSVRGSQPRAVQRRPHVRSGDRLPFRRSVRGVVPLVGERETG